MQDAQSAKIAGVAGSTVSTPWRLYDNTDVELTVDELCGFPAAIKEFSKQLHIKAWTLKAQIDAATTKEEIEMVVW